ncbi:MAG TPA: hypothetical protein VHZ51_02490 [Ktedonobacteraceae bacterium]|jgi:hypothetical protein|nr:hypothetical protein [Ktedonobacteraceae bacterium]
MRWFQKKSSHNVDDYNDTTEPLPTHEQTPFIPMPMAPQDQEPTLPAAQFGYPPTQQRGPVPQPAPAPPAYPYVSQPPDAQQQNMPGGQGGAQAGKVSQQSNPGRHPIPLLIGLVFVYIQLLLLVRFVLKVIGLMIDQAWVNSIYGMSEPFITPFRALWQLVPIQLPAQVEMYTLLAVLIYGMCSRILVHVLKLFFRSRSHRN